MKRNIIIIEEDSLTEIEKIKKLLEASNVQFNYFPSMDNEIVTKTKNYFWSFFKTSKE